MNGDHLLCGCVCTDEEEEERNTLLQEGFKDWNKVDFHAYVRACERYGRKAIEKISQNVNGKTPEEVKAYHETFWKKYTTLAAKVYKPLIKRIEKGEARLKHQGEMEEIVQQALGPLTTKQMCTH